MARSPQILLTNDDGIDSMGLRVVYEALGDVAEVTVVAPQTDQSGTWRLRSYEFTVEEREPGYAVDGTPCDCVNFGLGGLDTDFDVVVSGCNPGPNLGAHIVVLSGTVGAARQAGFLGVPGVALSLYCLPEGDRDFEREDYAVVEEFVREFIPTLAASSEPGFDYLNVNVPDEVTASVPVHFTELTYHCDISVTKGEGCYERHDPFYDPLRPAVDQGLTGEVGMDRRAVGEGAISITPLQVRARHGDGSRLATLLDGYDSVGHDRLVTTDA